MEQSAVVKKTVLIDKRAQKELHSFPRIVQLKIRLLLEILERDGKLDSPNAKKMSGSAGLFELRVKHQGQWRVLYAYFEKPVILVLSAFAKKSQKTPKTELFKAEERLIAYQKGTL